MTGPVAQWTLTDWIGGWERTVAWVEDHPETFLFDEYEHAVAKRDGVTFTLGDDPVSGRALIPQIDSLDRRYKAVTLPVTEPVTRMRGGGWKGWWWYRVPVRVSDEFEEALIALFPQAAAEFERDKHARRE